MRDEVLEGLGLRLIDFKAREGFDPKLLHLFLMPDFKAGKMFWRERSEMFFPDTASKNVPARVLAGAWNSKHAGAQALCKPRPDGYLGGRLMGVNYLAHRVMYALAYGRWAAGEVDHINGDRTDNRPENLRDVPKVLNARNAKRAANNTSGATGVMLRKRDSKWIATIRMFGKTHYFGAYQDFFDAVAARKAAEAEFGFHPNHGRKA